MAALTTKQKQSWAETEICVNGLSQKEAAEKIGISPITVNRWYKKLGWKKRKQALLITKGKQIERLFMQVDELNTAIMGREEGKRFANSKEADTLLKLAASIERMEQNAGIADIIEVSKLFLDYLRNYTPEKAVEVGNIFNDFMMHRLKQS